MTELKPCPFCGSEPMEDKFLDLGGWWHTIKCCNCFCELLSREECRVEKAWNRRVEL